MKKLKIILAVMVIFTIAFFGDSLFAGAGTAVAGGLMLADMGEAEKQEFNQAISEAMQR